MKDKTYFVKDVSDGNDIAIVFSSFYLNCFPYRHEKFMIPMLGESEKIKHNFTMLCLKWFNELAKIEYYDDRNMDSVILARAIANDIPCNAIAFKKSHNNCVIQQINCKWQSDSDMQMLMKSYLTITDKIDPFIKHMLYTHKTLQQNFSRFCMDWFDTLCINECGRKSYILLAKEANKSRIPLRYI